MQMTVMFNHAATAARRFDPTQCRGGTRSLFHLVTRLMGGPANAAMHEDGRVAMIPVLILQTRGIQGHVYCRS
jgi:hypothetical protein